MIIKPKPYFIIIYCISFFFLIFDTFIGLLQVINIIQRGGGTLNTEEGQFRLTNLFIDLIILLGMSIFLLNIWRKLFVEDIEEPIISFSRLFKILSVVFGILIILMVILVANPFFIDIELNRSPIGHIYDIIIKAGLIFLLLGITGIVSIKIKEQKIEPSVNDF